MTDSGVKKCLDPSRYDLKWTHSSVTLASFSPLGVCIPSPREKTWNPPESVRIGDLYIHKWVESTKWLHHITSRTEIAMVVIHEHNLWTNLLDLIDRCSLDGWTSPNRHEYRSLDAPMRSMNNTSTSESIGCLKSKRKRRHIKIFEKFWTNYMKTGIKSELCSVFCKKQKIMREYWYEF